MELSFIGIGSAFSEDINNSAFIKCGGNMLLIDCGENVFSEVKHRGLVENVDNLYVFITHTHSDHIGSLSSLINYMHYVKNRRVHLIYSDSYKIRGEIEALLKINGNNENQFDFVKAEDIKGKFGLENIAIYNVRHSPNMKAYAIKLGKNDKNGKLKNVYFTGDCCDVEFLKSALRDENLEKIYCDVSLYGGVHLKYEDAIKLFASHKDKVCFMHLENGFIKNRLKREGFSYAKQGVDYFYEK